MGWSDRETAIPNWDGTVDAIRECLENVLMQLDLGKEEGLRSDVMALDALDELDSFLSALKRDLGAV